MSAPKNNLGDMIRRYEAANGAESSSIGGDKGAGGKVSGLRRAQVEVRGLG